MRGVSLALSLLALACGGEEFTSDRDGTGSGGASGSGGSAAAGGTAGATSGGAGGALTGGAGGSVAGGGGGPGGAGGASGGTGGASGGTGGASGGKGGASGGTSGAGGGATCPPIAGGAAFPSTPMLDNFNLPDGPLATAKWGGSLSAFGIKGQQLIHKTGFSGDDEILMQELKCLHQEVWVTIKHVDTAAQSIGLQLKTQPGSVNCEQIEVDYVPSGKYVHVTSCAGGTWTDHGLNMVKTLVDGDQFGARVRADKGTVEVFVNNSLLGTVTVSGFPHMQKGGRIGLAVWQGTGTSVFDDFGGGP